jgi:predicted NAD/FAD-binding protein
MNPPKEPKHIVDKWQTSHLIPSLATATAAKQLEGIQGKQGIWFCGAYQGIYLMCHIDDAVFLFENHEVMSTIGEIYANPSIPA